MKKKLWANAFILVLSFMFVICYITIPSNAKYVYKLNAPFEGQTSLDFTMNDVLEVDSQEELFAAINNGYSFIQINKEVENPLIITQNAETLNSDLILDLNGIEIQRNGAQPILNISPGVRLTVIDTSVEQTGGLYNPVGSVFNITGGTLTVGNGVFESGPRYSEYYSYNANILNKNNDDTERTDIENVAQKVLYYVNTAENGVVHTSAPTNEYMPIIKSYPEITNEITYNHGNLYFDQAVAVPNATKTINRDTYCYFYTDDNPLTSSVNPATASWYYTYWADVTKNYSYVAATIEEIPNSTNRSDCVLVTIYGYENTISTAKNISQTKDYYAAIQMQSGSLEVKKGGFHSYFGVENTACVNSLGGTITVTSGEFSSRIPNATSAVINSVNEAELDKDSFGEDYFNNFIWRANDLAAKGISYCILNSGEAVVSVVSGEFYSSNSNIVNMNGGVLTVGGGKFTKTNTTELVSAISSAAAVYMVDGTLSVSNATYTVNGNYDYGVLMENGSLTFDNVSCDINGENAHGIYLSQGYLDMEGGSFIVEGNGSRGIYMADGTLEIASGTLDISGEDSYGVFMENGTLDIASGTLGISGANSRGVFMENGSLTFDRVSCDINGENAHGIYLSQGDLDITGGSFIVEGNGSRGVYMQDGTLDIEESSFAIKGDNAYGVYSTVSGQDKFNIKNTPIALSNGNNQVGVYTESGEVSLIADATANMNITLVGDNGTAVKATEGGSVDSINYNYMLSGSSSTGIHAIGGSVMVESGNISLSGSSSTGIHTIDGSVTLTTTSNSLINLTNTTSTAVKVENGSVESINYNYTLSGSSSTGIHAIGGSVIVEGGNISLSGSSSKGIHAEGGTVNVNSGNITLGSNVSSYGVYAVSANSADIIRVTLDKVVIDVGYSDNPTVKGRGTYESSVGVCLAAANSNSLINLVDTDISCYEVGVSLSGGSLNVSSTTDAQRMIKTNYASAIAVFGGNLTFDSTANYAITSAVTSIGLYDAADTNAEYNTCNSNVYNITLPQINRGIVQTAYDNADGIYVSGGTFVSNGNVTITHTGLYNRTDETTYAGVAVGSPTNSTGKGYITSIMTDYYYTSLVVKSYAVRVEGGSVTITKGNVRALVGGGIYCSKTGNANSDITLGQQGMMQEDISVTTTGQKMGDWYNAISKNHGTGWVSRQSVSGGHAIELNGGNITVYGGKYEAYFGNGVAANGSGNINIYSGTFNGWMGYNVTNQQYETIRYQSTVAPSGPSAFYGLKVIGGATVNIFGGKFDGGNGGAFITGIDSFSVSGNNNNPKYEGSARNGNAKVYIYSGVFGNSGTQNLDGFNIYDASTVIFGAYRSPNSNVDDELKSPYTSATQYRNAIVVYAQNATIASNPITNGTAISSSTIRIYYGDYTRMSDTQEATKGVYGGNGTPTVYNSRNNIGYSLVKGDINTANGNNVVYYTGT